VNFEGDNSKVSNMIKKTLMEEGINIKQHCPFTLKATYKLLSQCNNPTGKSIGADFDGFLRFDLYENENLVYRCQIDWKGEFGKDKIKDLIKRMKEDLNFSSF